jgi:hypothetical protein
MHGESACKICFLDVFEVCLMMIRFSNYFDYAPGALYLFSMWRFTSGRHSKGLLLFKMGLAL